MSKHSAAWALPLDERPPAFTPDVPEQHPHGDAETATTSEDTASPPPRGGPSLGEMLDVIDVHLGLVVHELKEVFSARKIVRENVSAIVMRAPVSHLLLQIDALKAVVLDLQRITGRRAKP